MSTYRTEQLLEQILKALEALAGVRPPKAKKPKAKKPAFPRSWKLIADDPLEDGWLCNLNRFRDCNRFAWCKQKADGDGRGACRKHARMAAERKDWT